MLKGLITNTRVFAKTCERHKIIIFADALSRFQMRRFWKDAKQSGKEISICTQTKYPMNLTWKKSGSSNGASLYGTCDNVNFEITFAIYGKFLFLETVNQNKFPSLFTARRDVDKSILRRD